VQVQIAEMKKGTPPAICPPERLAINRSIKPKRQSRRTIVKNTSKWITAAAVLGLSATLAFAGTGMGEGHSHGFGGKWRHHGFSKLASKLNLTDAQKAQWKAIRKSSHEQNAAFFQQAHQTMKDFHAAKKAGDTAKADALKPAIESQRAQMKQIRAAEQQQFVKILTAEQSAQYQTLKAERAARHAARESQEKK
jgi:periplasmic protein CpxP/Spy